MEERYIARMTREKETKNSVRFSEDIEEGKPPVIRQMYLPKWWVGTARVILVTVEKQAS